MSGKKFFQIDPENRPNRTVSERVVSERGRKELPPSTRGGENLKPNRYYEHKQHTFDSYCKKVLKCEACNGYRQISRHQKRFASLEELSEADVAQLAVYDRYSWEYTAFPVGNAVVLIDEVDRSLHTKAVQEFINYFYSLTEQNASQLIVTTHDSNIMNLDFVRQDEVWFIERQKDHSSKLYSLNKFMARFDKKVEKDYLLGRYGAIPIFRQVALEPGALEEGEQSAEGS